MIETILGTYYLTGVGFIIMLLILDKPALNWKWLWLPLVALMWPLMIFVIIRDGTYRGF